MELRTSSDIEIELLVPNENFVPTGVLRRAGNFVMQRVVDIGLPQVYISSSIVLGQQWFTYCNVMRDALFAHDFAICIFIRRVVRHLPYVGRVVSKFSSLEFDFLP